MLPGSENNLESVFFPVNGECERYYQSLRMSQEPRTRKNDSKISLYESLSVLIPSGLRHYIIRIGAKRGLYLYTNKPSP
jgi:hypothetical protein